MLNNINTILSLSHIDKEGNKYSTNDILLKYINEDGVYVTFTEINKVGINPTSEFDTPLGIYCYPIKEAYNYYVKRKGKKDFIQSLPFANKNPFFSIIKEKDSNKIIKNNIYTEEQLSEDFLKIKKIYKTKFNNSEDYFNYILKTQSKNIPYNIKTPIAKIFYLTYRAAKKDPIKWNKMFRYLGYEGFVDPGYSIIHENEPCQAVFFSVKNINVIGTYDNRYDNITDNVISKKTIDYNDESVSYKKFINCNINLNITKNGKYYSLSNSSIKNSKLNINSNTFLIRTCNIKNTKIKNSGFIEDCNINSSVIDNIINPEKFSLSNISLVSCNIKDGNLKKIFCAQSAIYDANINTIVSNKSSIYNCNINNSADLNYSVINNTNVNDCNRFIINECEINDTKFINTNIILFGFKKTKFNNVLIDGVNLLDIKNHEELKDVRLYFEYPSSSYLSNSGNDIIRIYKIKDFKEDKIFKHFIYNFLENNYPNVLEIIKNS